MRKFVLNTLLIIVMCSMWYGLAYLAATQFVFKSYFNFGWFLFFVIFMGLNFYSTAKSMFTMYDGGEESEPNNAAYYRSLIKPPRIEEQLEEERGREGKRGGRAPASGHPYIYKTSKG